MVDVMDELLTVGVGLSAEQSQEDHHDNIVLIILWVLNDGVTQQ